MKKEIVKYENQLNTIPLTKFNGFDLDLFMLICAKMRNKGQELQVFSYDELKETLGMSRRSDKEFQAEIDQITQKLTDLGTTVRNNTAFGHFKLFPTFFGSLEEVENDPIFGHVTARTLRVRVNPDLAFLLNEIGSQFTRFEFSEFIRLESKYSKNLYRLLKQYRTTGTYKVNADRFRELMDCPEKYKNMTFMRDCVNVAVTELSHGFFEDLSVTPIRAHKRGAPIVAYEFTFKKSDQIPGQMSMEDYAPAEELIKQKPKPKKAGYKNRFNNFHQRDYDFNALEKGLLTQQRADQEGGGAE